MYHKHTNTIDFGGCENDTGYNKIYPMYQISVIAIILMGVIFHKQFTKSNMNMISGNEINKRKTTYIA